MASLTNVTQLLDSIINPRPGTQRPLDWPSGRLNAYLTKCPTTDDTLRWHENSMRKIHEVNDNSLKRLCLGVTTYMVRAINKLEELRSRTAGDSSFDGWTGRQAAISSLKDVTAAFDQFSVVSTDDDLGSPQARDVVLVYLRMTYRLMITIRWVLEPCDDDHDWLMENFHYLQVTDLQNFKFDSVTDYPKQREGKTTHEVLENPAEMPPSCLPAFPQPPVLCKNTGPYGARVFRNEFYMSGQNQDCYRSGWKLTLSNRLWTELLCSFYRFV
jgi:hypothetical protein